MKAKAIKLARAPLTFLDCMLPLAGPNRESFKLIISMVKLDLADFIKAIILPMRTWRFHTGSASGSHIYIRVSLKIVASGSGSDREAEPYECTVQQGFGQYIARLLNSICLSADTPAPTGSRLSRAVDF